MQHSVSRILTIHVGSLVRPSDLVELCRTKESGQPYNAQQLATRVRSAVSAAVRQQAEAGIDVPSDGEYGKPNFAGYVNERLSGFERRQRNPEESPILNWGRDRKAFLDFYREYEGSMRGVEAQPVVCAGPITYVGQAAVQRDIETFRAVLAEVQVSEAFLHAGAPGNH